VRSRYAAGMCDGSGGVEVNSRAVMKEVSACCQKMGR
jgi:hypothetical protein